MESAISKSEHVPCVLLEIKPRLLGDSLTLSFFNKILN